MMTISGILPTGTTEITLCPVPSQFFKRGDATVYGMPLSLVPDTTGYISVDLYEDLAPIDVDQRWKWEVVEAHGNDRYLWYITPAAGVYDYKTLRPSEVRKL